MLGIGTGVPFNTTVDPSAVVKALFASGENGVWYDPSDFSTLFQDTAGATPVTAVGQTVKKILDKSGRGNHATSSVGSVLQQDGAGKYYLAFNGTTTSFNTASIDFSATDKISLIYGAYTSTTSMQMVVELSANTSSNAGTFYASLGSDVYTQAEVVARGTTAVSSILAAGVNASMPVLAVISSNNDISGNRTTFRKNTVASTDATGSKGTGNFGNYPIYIGSRGGASIRLNGRLYGLIVRGALNTATQITNVETYMNSKTGAY